MDKQFFDEYFDSESYDEQDDTPHTKKDGKTFTKGFLTALAICLVAIGASVWTTVKNVHSYLYPDVELPISSDTDCDVNSDKSSALPSYVVESDVQVNAEVSGVKKSDDKKVVFTYTPVNGNQIITEYSEDPVYNETLGDYRAHPAIDYGADIDDKVRTMAMGRPGRPAPVPTSASKAPEGNRPGYANTGSRLSPRWRRGISSSGTLVRSIFLFHSMSISR